MKLLGYALSRVVCDSSGVVCCGQLTMPPSVKKIIYETRSQQRRYLLWSADERPSPARAFDLEESFHKVLRAQNTTNFERQKYEQRRQLI